MTQSERQERGNIGLEYLTGLYKDAIVETKEPQPIYIVHRDTIKAFLHEKLALLAVRGRLLGLLGIEVALVTSLFTATFKDFSWIKGETLQGIFITTTIFVAMYIITNLICILKNWGAYSVDILTEDLGSRGSKIGKQLKEMKSKHIASDVTIQVQLMENLRIMCWDGKLWRSKQLNEMTIVQQEWGLELTNTTNIHRFAIIILNIELTGNFRVQLKLQGEYKNVRINASTGEDRCLYATPSPEQLDKSDIHTIIVTRQRNQVAFRTGEEVDLPMRAYQGTPDMPCFVGIELNNQKSVKIFSFDLMES